jgi:hypothetical protein
MFRCQVRDRKMLLGCICEYSFLCSYVYCLWCCIIEVMVQAQICVVLCLSSTYMQWKLRTQDQNLGPGYYILISTHRWELMKSVESHGSIFSWIICV